MALPELWTDWCSVVGVPELRVDEPTLTRFSRQAGPPKAVLSALRRVLASEPQTAPAWPREYRDDFMSLQRLIRRATVIIQNSTTNWVFRIRLRRMLFAAVLLAPPSHGGLGLDRAGALDLHPDDMRRLRQKIGVTDDQASCPACAVWSWLDVLGTNNGWSRGAVRALGHRRDEDGPEHRHLLPDPTADWHLCVGMLPAVDRWGWIGIYSSMHPSSLSAVVSAMGLLLDGPESVPAPVPEPRPMGTRREISPEEEARILAHADKLTRRVAAILEEYS